MATSEPVTAGEVISRIRRAGADGLVIEFSDPAWVTALDAAARERWSGPAARDRRVRDIVPAAHSLLLDGIALGDGRGRAAAALGSDDVEGLARELSSWTLSAPQSRNAPRVDVPVVFDGPDLESVAGMWDMTVADAIATVVGCEFQVAFCGFAPGFGYMTGLPDGREVPRRSSPRTRVPAGSFGLAGQYAGLYPRSSPGGWQLLGTAVGVALWDESREPPALLTPGTRVRILEHEGETT
ncbi:5-oxoprolinase subunit B family protein [Demequina sp. SO4-18]|uniref:5-oxoprolinase subunit B family protein n=1 Tax=Demequina sp. SO4-18 TaxID=3401026 RepID=UPI003B5AF95E